MKNIIPAILLLIILYSCNSDGRPSENKDQKLPFNYKVIYPQEGVNSDNPVLFLMHGYGANSDDLLFIKEYIRQDFIIVAIEAPVKIHENGYSWFSLEFENGMVSSYDHVEAAKSTEDLGFFIENVIDKVNPECDNVFLLGFSQGGYLALSYYMSNPDKYYSVAVLSGMMDDDLLTKEPTCTGQLFVGHGVFDEVIPVSVGRNIRDHFVLCKELTYKEYEMPHSICKEELRDLGLWFEENLN